VLHVPKVTEEIDRTPKSYSSVLNEDTSLDKIFQSQLVDMLFKHEV